MATSSYIKIDTLPFKEWMTAILTVTKIDTLFQVING